MKPTDIMPPHKEQDGWAYVRVLIHRQFSTGEGRYPIGNVVPGRGIGDFVAYYHDHDGHSSSRIISSRRTEEAVETLDFLRVCAEEGLDAVLRGDGEASRWWVCDSITNRSGHTAGESGGTLRQAYFRYKAAVQND